MDCPYGNGCGVGGGLANNWWFIIGLIVAMYVAWRVHGYVTKRRAAREQELRDLKDRLRKLEDAP
jgi:hypothetical protein